MSTEYRNVLHNYLNIALLECSNRPVLNRMIHRVED